MNAYCNARLLVGDTVIWLSASFNTAGLVSGDVEHQIEGIVRNEGGTFRYNPRVAIAPPDPPGPPMSETYTTDDYNGQGASVELDAEHDAYVHAYVDGFDANGNSHGRKHVIKWIADEERYTCYIETRVNGQWVRDTDYDGCRPQG